MYILDSSLKLFFSLFISIFLAGFVVNALPEEKERNDIVAYASHYDCLLQVGSGDSIYVCGDRIGNPPDFLYENFVAFFSGFLSVENFSIPLFFISFFIYFSVIYVSVSVSKLWFYSLVFLLVDFRFYELGNNILRNGISLSFLMWFVYFNYKGFWRLALSNAFLSVASHITVSPAYLVAGKFLGFWFVIISMLIIYLILYFLPFLLTYAPEVFQSKYHAYDVEFSHVDLSFLPLHYILILIVSVFLVGLKGFYGFIFGLFLMFSYLSFLMSGSGIGYRFVNFAMPFASILASYIFYYIHRRLGRVALYFFSMVYLLFAFALFCKNYEFIVRAY